MMRRLHRTMKRLLIAAVLCLPLLWLFVGCGGSSDVPEGPGQPLNSGASLKTEASEPQERAQASEKPEESEGVGAAEGWGNLAARFVFLGEVPEPKQINVTKDQQVCGTHGVFSEELVVNAETRGIANVFVYLRQSPRVHPDLVKPDTETVEFDQKGCVFLKHALVLRTGQTMMVKSQDPVVHNTHTFPRRGTGQNSSIPANEQNGIAYSFSVAERLPFQIKCDIHPWMLAWGLTLDHPYGAVSDTNGELTLRNLPAGELTFVVWHEKGGYLDKVQSREGKFLVEKKSWTITIKDGETIDLGDIEVPAEEFQEF